jgi:diguanylate cyclase (GGDEF)-like protein
MFLEEGRKLSSLASPILQAKGFRIIDAASGLEAFELLGDARPDLVIVDDKLPDTDGVSWIATMRSSGNKAKVAFISSQWRDQNSYNRLTRDYQVLLVLHKPINASVFCEQIDAICEGEIRQLKNAAAHAGLNSKIDNLLNEYVAQLPKLVSELKRLLFAARTGGQLDVWALKEAYNYAHRLTGTAGSYGLLAIGELTGLLEMRLSYLQTNGATESSHRIDEIWDECFELVEKVSSEIADVTKARVQNQSAKTQAQIKLIDARATGAVLSEDSRLKATQARGSEPANGKTEQPATQNGDGQKTTNANNSKVIPAIQGPAAVKMPKLLVIDQDEAFLDLIEEFGKTRLVQILRAHTGEEALKIAREQGVDAALMDVQLGGNDISFDLAHKLRELPEHEKLPLAFVSGRAHIYNRVAAANAGACLYLNKPLSAADLEAAFMQLLADRVSDRPRVLVVDDDEEFSNLVAELLKTADMNVATLNDPVRILEVLPEIEPDVLILDVMMPGVSGFDVCRMLRTVPRWQQLPIIFLTAQTSMESRVMVYKCGGDDYLHKHCADNEFISRVQIRIDRARLFNEKAYKDNVTGLFSRRAALEQLNRMIAAAHKLKFSVSICMFDVENLKTINETYGYHAGDTVIGSIGLMLSRRFNIEDLRGRWGGDEFILALHATDAEDAQKSVDSFLKEFKLIEFHSDEGSFSVSMNAGVSTYPADGATAYDLIRVADSRLAIAKKTDQPVLSSKT